MVIIDRDAEVAAIRQLVEDVVKFQMDLQPFLDLHTEDVVIVNFVGKRVLGREALARAMKEALAGSLANVMTENTIEDIRFISPEVVLVCCSKHVYDKRNEKESVQNFAGSQGALTYIMVKKNNSWKISLAQTTPVVVL